MMIQKRAELNRMLTEMNEVHNVRKAMVDLTKQQIAGAKWKLKLLQTGNRELFKGSVAEWSESAIAGYVAEKEEQLKEERKLVSESKKSIKKVELAISKLTATIDKLGLDNTKLF
jgi:hypothetical protein